jgi:hypothetical protein
MCMLIAHSYKIVRTESSLRDTTFAINALDGKRETAQNGMNTPVPKISPQQIKTS